MKILDTCNLPTELKKEVKPVPAPVQPIASSNNEVSVFTPPVEAPKEEVKASQPEE